MLSSTRRQESWEFRESEWSMRVPFHRCPLAIHKARSTPSLRRLQKTSCNATRNRNLYARTFSSLIYSHISSILMSLTIALLQEVLVTEGWASSCNVLCYVPTAPNTCQASRSYNEPVSTTCSGVWCKVVIWEFRIHGTVGVCPQERIRKHSSW